MGRMDDRKSAAGAVALQNLAEVRRRAVVSKHFGVREPCPAFEAGGVELLVWTSWESSALLKKRFTAGRCATTRRCVRPPSPINDVLACGSRRAARVSITM